MPNHIQLEILTPERTGYKGVLSSLVAPAMDGFFGVLPQHAPLVTRSAGGKVIARESFGVAQDPAFVEGAPQVERSFRIGPGIVEVFENRVVILTKEVEEISGKRARQAE